MNFQTRRRVRNLIILIIIAVLVGAFLGAFGYHLFWSGSGTNAAAAPVAPAVSATSTAVNQNAPAPIVNIAPVSTSSGVIAGVSSTPSSAVVSSPATPAAMDMSSWQTYTNYELGFSVQYPPDLTVDSSDPSALTLTFPLSYFSAGSAEKDTFSISVSAVCAPEQSFNEEGVVIPSESTTIGGIAFEESFQESSTTGGEDVSTIYEGNNNDACYSIEYDSQASTTLNGTAGDASNIQDIVNSMLSTFTFTSMPSGENEADYAAQSASSSGDLSGQSAAGSPAAGAINLSGVSPSTVSVGGNLVLSGSGFSGHDTVVWISNGSVQGVLWGGMPSSDTSITEPVPSQACTQYTGASGAPCSSYLIISPGVYTVSVANQNGSTNPVYIRVQ